MIKTEKYDIIIQAGQSNAEGTGKGPVDREWEIDERILYMNVEKTITSTPTSLTVTYPDAPFTIIPAADRMVGDALTGDFSLTFARDYVDSGRLAPDRKLLIIRAAVGATGFKRHHWGMDEPLYLKMLEMTDHALHLHPENRIVALLWHQGEHDAVHGTDPEDFERWTAQLVRSVRARYGNDALPYVAGDFVPQWKSQNTEIVTPIENALRRICHKIGNAAFVESVGLLSNAQVLGNNDIIHFSRQSLQELGHRYFKAFSTLRT